MNKEPSPLITLCNKIVDDPTILLVLCVLAGLALDTTLSYILRIIQLFIK